MSLYAFLLRFKKGSSVIQIQDSPYNVVISFADDAALKKNMSEHKQFVLDTAKLILTLQMNPDPNSDIHVFEIERGEIKISRIVWLTKSVGIIERDGKKAANLIKAGENGAVSVQSETDGKYVRFEIVKCPGAVKTVYFDPYIERFGSSSESLKERLAVKTALKQLENYKEPNSSHIPEIIKLIANLPESPIIDRRVPIDPCGPWAMIDAKTKIISSLVKNVEGIKEGGHKEVELIKQALDIEKYLKDIDEKRKLTDLKRASVDALYRIKSDEAAIVHLEIIIKEKDEDNKKSLIGELGKYNLFRERIKKIYDEERASGHTTNNYIIFQKFLEDLKKNPISGVTFSFH